MNVSKTIYNITILNDVHINLTLEARRCEFIPRRCEFKFRSKQRIFRCSLQCQINMNLVFHTPEDGSEILFLITFVLYN